MVSIAADVRHVQACVLRQARSRQAGSAVRQTATAVAATQSRSQLCGINSEASTASRQLLGQQQHTGGGLQPVTGASGTLSVCQRTIVAAPAAGPAGFTAPPTALNPSTLADQGPILHQPYSHLVWGSYLLAKWHMLYIAKPLCTDIQAVQLADGSCSVQVYLVIHSADWDVKGYVLQHPVMQDQQQVQQWAAQASDSAAGNILGPVEAVLSRRRQGQLQLTGVPRLGSEADPHAYVLQERVRC
jgi:hypothetical protein